jgi:predicted outer membrane lipoprotein
MHWLLGWPLAGAFSVVAEMTLQLGTRAPPRQASATFKRIIDQTLIIPPPLAFLESWSSHSMLVITFKT